MEDVYSNMKNDFMAAILNKKKGILVIESKEADLSISCIFDPGDVVYDVEGNFAIYTDNGLDINFSIDNIIEVTHDEIDNAYRVITQSFEFFIGVI